MSSEALDPFDDVDVSAFAVESAEPLGAEEKQWLRDPDDRRWLFKWLSERQVELGRGEDWAEKAVGEIGILLGIPCAVVELAHRSGTRGIISLYFVPDDLALDHGNELLARFDLLYPQAATQRKIAKYRVDTVMGVLDRVPWASSSGRPATEDFAGYLVLDALVANTDRHHENWGALVERNESRTPMRIAPSFDHASGLACGLTDKERVERLHTKDSGFSLEAFARRARSRFADALTLDDAVARIHEIVPDALVPWRERLAGVPMDDVDAILARIPASRMTTPARDFAAALVRTNHVRLLDLMEGLR